jgi:hypothetical protein
MQIEKRTVAGEAPDESVRRENIFTRHGGCPTIVMSESLPYRREICKKGCFDDAC